MNEMLQANDRKLTTNFHLLNFSTSSINLLSKCLTPIEGWNSCIAPKFDRSVGSNDVTIQNDRTILNL